MTHSKGGQFYEIFGEYTRQFFGASQAGIFARWNTATAKSSGTADIINNLPYRILTTYTVSKHMDAWWPGYLGLQHTIL